jgi:ABC-2 type transport system permease protein
VSRVGIVIGKIAGSASLAMMNASVILVVVIIFGVIPISSLSVLGIIETYVFMALISVIFISIGLLIASFINNVEGFQVIVNFLIMPLFFLSGAIFPIGSTAPIWMQGLAAIDPLKYGVDGMRGALIGVHTNSIYLDMAVMLIVAVAFILVADWSFKKMQAK